MVTTNAQNRYDIVLDEIMADPSPQVGLPNYEWIELKNISAFPVNLQNWRIADANGQGGPMPSFLLKPDSMVIVCSNTAGPALSAFGSTITVSSFPALDNEGDELILKAANGSIIHAVSYSSSWYQNELKKEGGWTLEMIDTKNPCSGYSNWKASIDIKGGSPGKPNSIEAINIDMTPPAVKNAYCPDSATIILVYSEPVDSISAATIADYSFELPISEAITLSPFFNSVQLKLRTPLEANKVYTITVSNVRDCKGNVTGIANTAKLGLPVTALSNDIVINEILFNPRPNAFDYVELYNNSNKIIDAAGLYIGNRSLSPAPYYIFPGDYFVITEDADRLALNYLVRFPGNILKLSLPSFPDNEGDVILLNFQGELVDKVHYKDAWHFSLITDTEGVALERINPSSPSQDALNWHSAASTAGYGTPTYKNSQYSNPEGIATIIKVSPAIFSPDNDGFDDIAIIQYKIDVPGYVANITLFDAAGRPVRNLVRNSTMGVTGYWNWDGLNDKYQPLPAGIYIIYTELFNAQGKKQRFKSSIILARKLK
jgi:hypothetical protein